MAEKSNGAKRYNLVLPNELYEELKKTADEQGSTVVEMIRKFIRIGLLAVKLQDEPGSALIIREGDSERQVLIF